jgi:molybdate transport system substrate-binding protein
LSSIVKWIFGIRLKIPGEQDIYFPDSSGYMVKAKREGDVFFRDEKAVVYLVPTINVQKGNPKNIQRFR